MSRTDDGSVCPKSMNGEHCQHFYYDWEPAPLEGHHEGHDGPHCCYCDRDRDRLLSENAVVEALRERMKSHGAGDVCDADGKFSDGEADTCNPADYERITELADAIAIIRALPSALSPPEGP